MVKQLCIATLAVLVLSGTLSAQNIATKYLSGEQVKTRTEVVMTKIPWVNDLDELKTKAAADNKLIFWMQIVGDLDGGL